MNSKIKPILLLLLLLILLQPAFAARIERLIDTWRPEHYVVDLTLNDRLSEFTSARASINILIVKQTNLIDLDFGKLTTKSVTLNSKSLPFAHKDGKLTVTLPAPADPGTRLMLVIEYSGKPKDGLILTNDKDGKPSAVGDNWPNRVHHWIPTLDHPSAKATVTFNVTAPAREEVVANGKLDQVKTTASGQRTWTYAQGVPIPPYCMIIAVGQFAKIVPEETSLTPLSYYVPYSDGPLALKGFAPTIPSLEYFSQTVGPYPYEKLAMIVGATRFGGMENSSAIVFTTSLLTRPPANAGMSKTYGIPAGNVNLIAHEIAHQWFGDSVTGATWADLWLSEGFATYFAGLFVQRYEGEEAFQQYLTSSAANVFAYERITRTPIYDRDTEDLFKLLNANNYQKGGWVLHMLRSQLGDQAFFAGIRAYYEAHKSSTATTEDLRMALEKSSGAQLKVFFDRWVYGVGHPQYELAWTWQDAGGLKVELKQVQQGEAFVDPLPISIVTSKETIEVELVPKNKIMTQTLAVLEKPLRIDVDVRNTLLKEARVREVAR